MGSRRFGYSLAKPVWLTISRTAWDANHGGWHPKACFCTPLVSLCYNGCSGTCDPACLLKERLRAHEAWRPAFSTAWDLDSDRRRIGLFCSFAAEFRESGAYPSANSGTEAQDRHRSDRHSKQYGDYRHGGFSYNRGYSRK